MPQSKLVLVTGATGKQGGAVVEVLLSRGHQVRALTRNSASPAANRLREQGVEIAVGDFTDHDSLVRATRGADAVYAMSTPYERGAEEEIAQGIAITDAAKAVGVAHFIYSSVASANRATGIRHFDGKYAVEKHLQASGVPYTIVAPVFFMENLLQPWTLPSLRQGKLTMAPPEVLRAQSEDMARMFGWFDSTGYAADIKNLRRDFPEVTWHTFEEWARKQDWSVLDQG